MNKSRNKNHKKNLTNHSVKRARQRTGITKNQLHDIALRAKTDGLHEGNTRGELFDLIKRLEHRDNYVRFYANALYIFKKHVLITVIDADPKYEKNLLQYVSIPTFIWYKQNRVKRKRDSSNLIKEIHEEAKNALRPVAEEGELYTIKALTVSSSKAGVITLEATKRMSEEFQEQAENIILTLQSKFGLTVEVVGSSAMDLRFKSWVSILNFFHRVATADDDTTVDYAYNTCKNVCRIHQHERALLLYYITKLMVHDYTVITREDYITRLNKIKESYLSNSQHGYISKAMFVGEYTNRLGETFEIKGYKYQNYDLITPEGVRYENLKNIRKLDENGKVIDNGATGKSTEKVKRTTTYQFVDLWGQVQWEENIDI